MQLALVLGGLFVILVIDAGRKNQMSSFWAGLVDDVRPYDRVVEP